MKHCAKCGETKPLDDFYRAKKETTGRQSYCKVCVLAVKNKWRNENRGRDNARELARTRANADQINARRRELHAEDPEKANSHSRAWCADNPEAAARYTRKWRTENPEKNAAKSLRKHNKEKQSRLAGDEAALKLRRAGKPGPEFDIDHIIPINGVTDDGYEVSGLDVSWNIQYLLPEANTAKGRHAYAGTELAPTVANGRLYSFDNMALEEMLA